MAEVAAPQPGAPVPRKRWAARLLKGTVAALLAAVILLVGGLSILLLTFDPNQYKATLIQVVKEREHRTLALPGTVELVESLGAETLIYVTVDSGAQLVSRQPVRSNLHNGDRVGVFVEAANAHRFDAQGRAARAG